MKLSRICNLNYTATVPQINRAGDVYWRLMPHISAINCGIFLLTTVSDMGLCGIIIFTVMPTDPEAKRKALKASGTFNPRAAQVLHPLFQQSSFFDPEDLLQLKYETLRALEVESCPIAKAARDFGLSRPTIYEAQNQFQEQGLEGLLPHKRGPKAAHKLTNEVLQYVKDHIASESDIKAEELARRVRQRFGVKLHPRTIQKALNGRAKRGRAK